MSNIFSAPNLIDQFELDLQKSFQKIDQISLFNHRKIINAFQKARISSEHFNQTTGYGHDDLGRQKLDQLFALIFATEAALARVNFVSGTHAIACAILGNLKPADEIIFAFGQPYDTLQSILDYIQSDLNGKVHINEVTDWQDLNEIIENTLKLINDKTKIIAIQRSRGYSAIRPSYSISQIAELIKAIKFKYPEIICFVDNCYGEFVEKQEPTEVGADLMAGSLIKNPGAGIVLTGGYVVGKQGLIDKTANRLTCPGVGAEGGPNFNQGRLLFQGIYLSPMIVSQILKGIILSAKVCEHLNLSTSPSSGELRTDIIQRLDFGNKKELIEFCHSLQKNSPIDSHLMPIPACTPGYQDELIMAAGTFIEGSTSELSADGPLREPYSAYLQGGLSYFYTRLFLENWLTQRLSF